MNPQQASAFAKATADDPASRDHSPKGDGGTVLLVRHGHTRLNSEKGERLRGWLDIPLTSEGRADASQAGEELKACNVGHLVSSDLRRARQTAQIIGERIGIKPEVNEGLRPWNVGKLAGKQVEDIRDELEHYQLHPGEKVPEGESFNDFYDRWERELLALLKKAEGDPSRTVVACTHVRNLLTAPHILAGEKGPIQVVGKPHPSPGRITPIKKKNRKWRIDISNFK